MSLDYRETRPSALLRPFVECLWMAHDPVVANAPRTPEHVIPDACPELIVQLGDPFSRWVDGAWREQPRAFLAGTLTRPWRLRGGSRLHTCGIRFRPGAINALFDLDMATATDREVPLATVCGETAAAALGAALVNSPGASSATNSDHPAAACTAAADGWLLDRLDDRSASRGVRAPRTQASQTRERVTQPAVELILASRGQHRIDDVAAELAVSRRRLERAFARDLGIRPKLFARIVRLNAALATLGRDEREPAALVALDAGYFDQAHLLRDFRAVAGRRPTAAREEDGELARHFTDPDRLLELLAGE